MKILDLRQMKRVFRRMAGEVVEQNHGVEGLMLVGIQTRGVNVARALQEEIEAMEGVQVPCGSVDITLYRDDLSTIGPQAVVKSTDLGHDPTDRVVFLCDDVLFTGRTVRAGIDAIMDWGRPRSIRLAVLIDRGHRELPIQADVVGQEVQTQPEDEVSVAFESVDGRDEVVLMTGARAHD